jgi:predicted ATP-dependent serine protease
VLSNVVASGDVNLAIGATPPVTEDVRRLQQISEDSLEDLARGAFLIWNDSEVRIQRTVRDALLGAAKAGSLALVGDPGIGKSALLVELALRLAPATVILFRVGEVAARSVGELRTELSLSHAIPEVLDNFSGSEPAFLLIDALAGC